MHPSATRNCCYPPVPVCMPWQRGHPRVCTGQPFLSESIAIHGPHTLFPSHEVIVPYSQATSPTTPPPHSHPTPTTTLTPPTTTLTPPTTTSPTPPPNPCPTPTTTTPTTTTTPCPTPTTPTPTPSPTPTPTPTPTTTIPTPTPTPTTTTPTPTTTTPNPTTPTPSPTPSPTPTPTTTTTFTSSSSSSTSPPPSPCLCVPLSPRSSPFPHFANLQNPGDCQRLKDPPTAAAVHRTPSWGPSPSSRSGCCLSPARLARPGASSADTRMAAAPKLRVLCLHGASQDAEIFSQRLRPLQKKCAAHAHFVFADAPHHLPTAAGQMVAMRVWWQTDADAVPYCGWPASLEALRAFWRRHGPFDGALGFSQGGAVACLMAGLAHATPGEFPGLRFVVVAGSPAPDLTYFPDVDLRGPLPCPSLHFVGRADAAVPPAESAALAETWFARAQVHRHEQGHVFPTRGPDVAAVQAFLADQQRRPPTAGPGAAATGAQSGAAPAVAAAPAPGPSEDPADAAVARLPRAAAAYAGALEEQEMELQALQAIFTDDELTVVHDRPPFQFTAKVRLEDEGLRPAFLPVVRFWLPPEYPDGAAPIIKVEGMGSIAEMCAQLGGHLVAFAEENKGMTMVFQVFVGHGRRPWRGLRGGRCRMKSPPAPLPRGRGEGRG